MDILLSTDINYVMPTGVLMTSIGMNCCKNIHFHVLINESFPPECKKDLKEIAEKYGNVISFYVITSEKTKDFPIGKSNQHSHITISAYYRLLITEVLPKDIKKILYLDGDMIVRSSLVDLWETNLDNYAMGVVEDCGKGSQTAGKRLHYPDSYGYFNSGMLLINLDYWRHNSLYQIFVEYISNNQDKLAFHDQDVLNATLFDQCKWLPLTYNFQSSFILKPEYTDYTKRTREEIEKTKYEPVIIHYVSSSKPWDINCFFGYRGAWRYYWRKTPWYKQGLRNDKAVTFKDWVRNFLLRHQLFFPAKMHQRIIINR